MTLLRTLSAAFLILLVASSAARAGAKTVSEDKVLAPPLEWFEEWVKETGERAPKFSEMKTMPDLPPLLRLEDGTAVESPEQWTRRREEMRELLCHWIVGQFPSEVPKITEVEILKEERERGSIRQIVRLAFATVPVASFTMEVLKPEGPGPFPIFLTQTNHRRAGLIGLSRGYLVCVYPGADIDDQTDVFKEAYPEADWSLLARRAWLGSRALDYIQTLPEADAEKVCITGHSRNGKQSLIAAAFDERIKSVVSSSSGSGGITPFRFVTEADFMESVEFMSKSFPQWFHPRIRFFTGREEKLPIDIEAFLGLIAPRDCLISTALNDGVETTFAIERAYRSGQTVYEFLDRPEALRIRYRPASHEWGTEDAHSFFDWFDRSFGCGDTEFPETLYHEFDWTDWRSKQNPESLVPPSPLSETASADERREAILWSLGEAPPEGVSRGGGYGKAPEHVARLFNRDSGIDNSPDIERVPLSFGAYRRGNLYYDKTVEGPLPVAIWLHPFSYAKGYTGAYVRGPRVFKTLAEAGYAVFAFDQLGFGLRIEEGANFYDRYPTGSKLGAMVTDARAAVDCLLDGEGRFPEDAHSRDRLEFPDLDPKRIYCLGYSLGGTVGLYATALDDRIAGVASFSGFTPLRTDTDDSSTGGIRRWWEWYNLQPRLGLFDGKEDRIPYDFEDVLSLIAPRPCLVVSPVHDRAANHGDVEACVKKARAAWTENGRDNFLTHLAPDDYNRFEPVQHRMFLEWAEGLGERR